MKFRQMMPKHIAAKVPIEGYASRQGMTFEIKPPVSPHMITAIAT
jgi:hypothetical protein